MICLKKESSHSTGVNNLFGIEKESSKQLKRKWYMYIYHSQVDYSNSTGRRAFQNRNTNVNNTSSIERNDSNQNNDNKGNIFQKDKIQ